jgi:hypothetical protein
VPKPSPAPATSEQVAAAVPDYEVKLFLDPAKVLDVEFKPTRDAERTLDLKNSSRKIAMLFLDAPGPLSEGKRPLDAAGWNIRFRRFEDSDELELSYKRRYKIEPGQLAGALAQAAADGFDDTEQKDYNPQVEWGFERQTLSFTRKKETKAKGGELDLPAVGELRSLAVREIPGKLDRVKSPGWARQLLVKAHAFGPVLGKRWSGDWQGPELSFEVWLIRAQSGAGFEPVVELSFKEKTQADAEGFREKLRAFVRDQGWLIEDDEFKTKLILERYGPDDQGR